MSGDQYEKCPFCKLNVEKILESKYGKISMEEFNSLKSKLEVKAMDPTVRVDYEISMNSNGEFTIDFGAICSNCGMKWTDEFTSKPFKPPETKGTKK